MHVGINHSRSHLTVTEINDIRTFRHGNFTVNFRNEMIFYQNTLAALRQTVSAKLQLPAQLQFFSRLQKQRTIFLRNGREKSLVCG